MANRKRTDVVDVDKRPEVIDGMKKVKHAAKKEKPLALVTGVAKSIPEAL